MNFIQNDNQAESKTWERGTFKTTSLKLPAPKTGENTKGHRKSNN